MSVVADDLTLLGIEGVEMSAHASVSLDLPATGGQSIDLPLTLGVCEATGAPCLYFNIDPVRKAIANDEVRGRRKNMHLVR